MNGQRVGYVRVSTAEQNDARQLAGIEADRVFIDRASGKTADRPALVECLAYVRAGDVLVVHSMDRLARNLDDLRRIVKDLNAKGVVVQFLREGLSFSGDDSPMANMLLSMLGAVAEFERSLILERQREGIAIAKAKGVYKGRKPALNVEQVAELRQRVLAGEQKSALAREFGISRETLYRYAAG